MREIERERKGGREGRKEEGERESIFCEDAKLKLDLSHIFAAQV